MALKPIGKYWFKGYSLPAINQPEQTGQNRYWTFGFVLPVLNSYGSPPTPPPGGSSALPTGLRAARMEQEDWFPSFNRKFYPPVVAPTEIIFTFTIT